MVTTTRVLLMMFIGIINMARIQILNMKNPVVIGL